MYIYIEQLWKSYSWNDYANVEISTDGGATWPTVLLNQTAASPDPDTQNLDLSAYLTESNVKIRFYYDDDNSWALWWAIDNVKIEVY